MKIISWNVNGIRAVERKGELENFLKTYTPDIFLIQETKAKHEQLTEIIEKYSDYEQFYHTAEKPGYAGTAIWIQKSKIKNQKFITGMPDFDDNEGRIARLDFEKFSIFSVYFPNGGKSLEAWKGKLVFYDQFLKHVDKLKENARMVVWAGDINCAHEEIDIARPKENKNSIDRKSTV